MAYFRTGGGTDTSDANAVAGDILLNKTAYVNDEKVTGTMPNNGAISGTIEAGETFTVPAGYTSGGTITAIAAGATITVTYNSQFYNKTITCTKGSTTYTQTTTSSGSTTFNVNEEGIWTITCNGVSKTVNVVLSYTTQMAITKTITIHGANEDYITYTDATGSKVCQFASGATSKSVSITFIPPSQSITFTSTVAKNPNNLSQNYSKVITITESTTAIYVMPDSAIYWYGNTSHTFARDTSVLPNGTYNWNTPSGGTVNTHNLTVNATSTAGYNQNLVTPAEIDVSGYTSLKCISNIGYANTTYSSSATNAKCGVSIRTGATQQKISSVFLTTTNYYIDGSQIASINLSTNDSPIEVYAIWLE